MPESEKTGQYNDFDSRVGILRQRALLAGVKENDDGSFDFSRAVELLDRIDRSDAYKVDAEHSEAIYRLMTEHGWSRTSPDGRITNMVNTLDFKQTFNLEYSELDAIGFYKGGGAGVINGYLRGERSLGIDREKFHTLEALFSEEGKLPMSKGGELLFRGMPISTEDPLAEITDPAFMSTSISERIGAGFASSAHKRNGNGYLVRLVLPEGIRFLPAGGGEKEIILQKGLTIRPTRVYGTDTQEYKELSSREEFDGIIDAEIHIASEN